jgi:tetratricopeptide (TPR) repeat protein
VIGASGAIAGVTGIFLALFPRSNVICFFIFTGSLIEISSLWLVGLYFCVDVLRQVGEMLGSHGSNVAYMAHIAGYVYGFSVGFVLLALKVIPREECDVFFLFKQARRRAALRALNRGSAAGAWQSASADTGQRLADIKKRSGEIGESDRRLADARAEIHRMVAAHDLPAAAAKYRTLLREQTHTVLSEQRQLEIANQFAREGDHASAAATYELLLERYPQTHSATEVRLMLGLLYARQLSKPQRARELIERAKAMLTDAAQQRLAEQILSELPV